MGVSVFELMMIGFYDVSILLPESNRPAAGVQSVVSNGFDFCSLCPTVRTAKFPCCACWSAAITAPLVQRMPTNSVISECYLLNTLFAA